VYFEFPEAFFFLLVLVPLLFLLSRSERRSKEIANTYKSHPPAKTFFTTRLILIVVFIAALITVAAMPFVPYEKTGSFVFLTDVSRSMHARHSCSEPTLLDRAKKVMRASLSGVPEARFGIFAFDRFAFPITQLTNDHAYIDEVIEHGLYVGLTYEATRTELANALSVVAQKKQRLFGVYGDVRHVVLLSDGNIDGDFRRSLREPIQQLRNAGVRIFAVGIGNPEATPLMAVEAGQCTSRNVEVEGQKVMIPFRADVLKYIANETLGQYFSEAETDELVRALRAELRLEADQTARSGTPPSHRDVSWVFLAAATLALFGLMILRPARTLREIDELEP
jgi:hypothetical protein